MQLMAFVLSLLIGSSVFAGQDSVGVFYRPEKTVVLAIENFYRSHRLQDMMDAFGAGNRLLLISQDNGLKIDCGSNAQSASCTFRFFPSQVVEIGQKNVEALFSFTDLGVTSVADFEMTFESSMADRFIFRVKDGHVYLYAHKRNSDKYQQ